MDNSYISRTSGIGLFERKCTAVGYIATDIDPGLQLLGRKRTAVKQGARLRESNFFQNRERLGMRVVVLRVITATQMKGNRQADFFRNLQLPAKYTHLIIAR